MATTITQAIDNVLDERKNRNDIEAPLSAMSLSLNADGDRIVACLDGVDYTPTRYALVQIAKWHNVPVGVVNHFTKDTYQANGKINISRDSKDLDMLVYAMRNGIRENRSNLKKVYKFRTYDGNTMRAMLSDRYAIIDNVWYLERIKNIFSDWSEEPFFNHWSTDGDTLHGNLRIPGIDANKEDGEHGGMLFLGNCEIGTQRLSIAPAVWRQICTNGMMGWGKGQMWSKVHRGSIDLNSLASQVAVKISEKIDVARDGIEALDKTRQLSFMSGLKPSRIIAELGHRNKLSTGINGQIVAAIGEYGQHESKYRSLYGIINAITRVAHTQDPYEQQRLESVGGALCQLTSSRWEALNKSAASMSEEDYGKILGRAAA